MFYAEHFRLDKHKMQWRVLSNCGFQFMDWKCDQSEKRPEKTVVHFTYFFQVLQKHHITIKR